MLNISGYIQYRFWSEETSSISDVMIEYNRKIWAPLSGPSDESQLCALSEGKNQKNRAPAFKATSSGILKSFLINIHPVEKLNLIGLCQILSCVFIFLPLFRFSSFPGLSVFTAFA